MKPTRTPCHAFALFLAVGALFSGAALAQETGEADASAPSKLFGPDGKGRSAEGLRIMGTLDKNVIRSVIHKHREQVRYCYVKRVSERPGLHGKIEVRFQIDPEGAVQTAEVASSTAEDQPLEACIAGAVKRWRFPEPRGGGWVVVTYPFIFKVSSGSPSADAGTPER